MRILYRLQQFWLIVRAGALPTAAQRDIEAALNEQEAALFWRFTPGEQWHSYHVFCTLQAAGHTQPDLLAAALLHDVGKTQLPLSVWERSLIVLVDFLLPQRVATWGQGEAHGWRRPFVLKARHPTWGAEMARNAGSRPLIISLIAHHQDNVDETGVAGMTAAEVQLLRYLQWADNQN